MISKVNLIEEIFEKRTPKNKFPILNVIKKRFSPRIFSEESINDDTMSIIFEAARLSPSARNNQPWFYYWTRKGSNAHSRLIQCIPERNSWIKTAPILIITTHSPIEPDGNANKWSLYDLGASNYSLILQAQKLGLSARQVGSFDIEKTIEFFPEIEKPFIPFVLIAIGKMGSIEDYDKFDDKIIIDKELAEWSRKDKIDKEI